MERELRSACFNLNSDDFKAQNHWHIRRWPISGKRHFRHWKWWKADDDLRWPSTDDRWIPIILDVATTINFWLGSRPYPLYVHRTIKVDSILYQKFALWTYSPFRHEMSLLYLSGNILLRVLPYVCRHCNIKCF